MRRCDALNTERVKNILIVLLSAITLSLVFLIVQEEGRYSLSAGQQAAITRLLERNDIHLDGMVTSSRPMRELRLERYEYDLDALALRFFGADAYLPNGLSFEMIEIDGHYEMIFEAYGRAMAYSSENNWVVFEIDEGVTDENFATSPGGAAAEQLAVWYISELMGMPPGMELFDNVLNHEGHYVISFFSSYRGHVLYNDHIRVTVTERGVTQVLYSRVINHGFAGDARGIASGDEALLALLNHLRHASQIEGRVLLTDMFLAYFLVEEGGSFVGMPSYVFTVYIDGLRFNHVFNAHTSAHVWHEIIR